MRMFCVFTVLFGKWCKGEGISWTVPQIALGESSPIGSQSLQVVSANTDGNIKQVEIDEIKNNTPYFDSGMIPSYTGYLSKTAVMTCIVHGVKNEKSVSWIRSRDLRILTVGRYTYTSDLRFEALHEEDSNEWVLRIKTVQEKDEGKYECQITTKPIKTYNVFLKVVEPSSEILGAPDIYVNRESMINLTCIVKHAPNPPEEIIWRHGNESISYTSPRGGVSVVEERGEITTSFLLLQKARPRDSGIFTCHPVGMNPVDVLLHVLEEGEHPAAMQTNVASGNGMQIYINIFYLIPTIYLYLYS